MVDRSASLLSTIRTALDANPPSVSTPGTLRIHTLFSIPRQVKSLYPLAHIHPTDLEYNKRSTSISALKEQIFITASWVPHPSSSKTGSTSSDSKPDPKDAARDHSAPLLVLAMELYLYTIPESSAAVLYISKLDSSGYAPKAVPSSLGESVSAAVFGSANPEKRFGNTLTATLTSAITQHFSTFKHWDAKQYPVSHLSVHILARSQRAYLFPSSPENKDKKVLSDGGLIKWWRAVMSHVIVSTRDGHSPVRKANRSNEAEIDARAYYLIPGYTKLESHPLVPLVRDETIARTSSEHRTAEQVLTEAKWTYGHPYSSAGASCTVSDLPPLPLHWNTSNFVLSKSKGGQEKVQQDPNAEGYDPRKVRTVPTLMPHFSDDPKTRFLDEMARDAHEHSGWKTKSSSNAAEEGSKPPEVTKEEKENGIQDKLDISEFKGEANNVDKNVVRVMLLEFL
ncbi:hypothetical protein NDA16_004364 [Ustilago loliicola]|nr:hypothetical protein NDA16_004364 [Ustilago loliicola]